jgi:hypothetical protein
MTRWHWRDRLARHQGLTPVSAARADFRDLWPLWMGPPALSSEPRHGNTEMSRAAEAFKRRPTSSLLVVRADAEEGDRVDAPRRGLICPGQDGIAGAGPAPSPPVALIRVDTGS